MKAALRITKTITRDKAHKSSAKLINLIGGTLSENVITEGKILPPVTINAPMLKEMKVLKNEIIAKDLANKEYREMLKNVDAVNSKKEGAIVVTNKGTDPILEMDNFKKAADEVLSKKVGDTIKEGVDIQEDGHVDVASAVRQCKTITEDAMQMLQKLQTMSPEDALPTWWTNKLAVASNSMNKMRDYLLVPSVSEEVELDEKAGDENDMKKLVGELQNASKMHLAQSKRVKALSLIHI